MFGECDDIDSAGLIDGGAAGEHRRDPCTAQRERMSDGAADLAEANDGDARGFELHHRCAENLIKHRDHARRDQLAATAKTAEFHRLSHHRTRLILARRLRRGLRERVEEPSHDLSVGAGFGCDDVVSGPDLMADRAAVAPSQAHEFVARKFARIALHTAERAAKRHAHERRAQGRQHRVSLHGVERKPRSQTHAAEIRPECVGVLHAIALEQAMGAVVHFHGKLHHDLALGLGENNLLLMTKADHLRRGEQALGRFVKEITRLRRNPDFLENARGNGK